MKSGLTQAEVAALFGVSTRTIAGWESASAKSFTNLETKTISQLFLPFLLEQKIKDMAEQAFDAIPSELVTIWLVDKEECFTVPKTTRQAFAPDGNIPKTVCSLWEESLTTYPLRTGETLNLAGDAIIHHKAKKNKSNRASYLFQDGLCESLLHVPAFIPSSRGPQPILLLGLENKLMKQQGESGDSGESGESGEPGESGDGAAATAGSQYVVMKAKPGDQKVYGDNDVAAAEALAKTFRELLLEDMQLLGMIG